MACAHIIKGGIIMSKIKDYFAPRRLTSMAILIALQIVLARFAGYE
jgi:hypothetical protein